MIVSFTNDNPLKSDLNLKNFESVNNELGREPEKNTPDEYVREIENRQTDFVVSGEFQNDEIVDKPKTFIREFLMEERKRNESLHMKQIKVVKPKIENKLTKRSQKGKCYTCNPRKKVLEHIIQDNNGIIFHHDMCNRSIIVVTPKEHYTSFNDIPLESIGKIFKEINIFCNNWNIKDYNVSYNQGEWQTHKHFHLKIKSYDTIIKRMRGDHFRMLALQKSYNN